MPKISLYRPERGNDYKFIDRLVSEQYTVGGTDFYIHKYLGPSNPTNALSTIDQPQYDVLAESNIQDLLFLENRDRKYDQDVYHIRGVFNVQDLDFNLSQFGLFIDNDTIFATVHINDTISLLGRKPMSGDAVEIPMLRDEFALNNSDMSLPRFFVISDVGRAAEGFSAIWRPHLYRLKLNKIEDGPQYSDILNRPADEDANFQGDQVPNTVYHPGDIVRNQGQLYTVTNPLPPDTLFFTPYTGMDNNGRPVNENPNFQGSYVPTTAYTPGQIVYYQGQLYTVVNPSTGNLPTSTAFFAPYAGNLIGGVPASENPNYKGNYVPSNVYQPNDIVSYLGKLYTVTATPNGELPPDPLFFTPYTIPTNGGVPVIEDVNYQGGYDPLHNYQPGDLVNYQGQVYTVLAPTNGELPPDLLFFAPYTGNLIGGVPAQSDPSYKGVFVPTTHYVPGDVFSYLGKLYTVTQMTRDLLPPETGFLTPFTGETIQDLLSTGNRNLEINDILIQQAEADAALSGFETQQFFTLTAKDNDTYLDTADMSTVSADWTGLDASAILSTPLRSGYTGYLLGDGVPENGAPFGHGINFPSTPSKNDFFLRTDFLPNRLFRYNGTRWMKHEDSVRHTLTNTANRQTLKTSFINNNKVSTINGEQVPEKQDLSKVLRPRADF